MELRGGQALAEKALQHFLTSPLNFAHNACLCKNVEVKKAERRNDSLLDCLFIFGAAFNWTLNQSLVWKDGVMDSLGRSVDPPAYFQSDLECREGIAAQGDMYLLKSPPRIILFPFLVKSQGIRLCTALLTESGKKIIIKGFS